MATNAKGYPYPVGTDRVMDGDDAIKSLADAVAAKLGYQIATGQASGTMTAVASINIGVTFPAGVFTTPPRVAHAISTASQKTISCCSLPTTSGTTITVFTKDGAVTSQSTTVDWIAIQF